MAYTSWSVSFGEQPSATKWNILGTNDASFNDGTGIFGLKKDLLTTDSNPYKFSVYLSASQTGLTDATFTKVLFDTENFDTNSNFLSYKYTVPVTGYYQINFYIPLQSANNTGYAGIGALYVNGVEIDRTDVVTVPGANGVLFSATYSNLIQLTATDYIEVFGYLDVGSSTVTITGGAVSGARFSGYLVSRT